MKHRKIITRGVSVALAATILTGGEPVRAAEPDLESRVRLLQEQNEALDRQLREQRQMLDALHAELSEIRQSRLYNDGDPDAREPATPEDRGSAFGSGKVHLGGEGAVGLFHSDADGVAPNSEFRIDEARLFVDVQVIENAYAFGELNLATRESSDLDLRLGELYLDFEDVSQLWNRDRQLNLRAGRLDVPFGEEYLTRDAIDNPLISHSLPDFWGVDEGIEVYGSFGPIHYVAAVQNGGVPLTRDFDADKSVAGRLSYDPARWLHLSVSAMRTGDLHARDDFLSEIWFGNGWFRSLGSTNTTTFRASVVEGDIRIRLPRGHVAAFGGYVGYDDDDPAADNRRDVYFYSVEAVHELTGRLYAGARFSQIMAEDGFPIVGHGDAWKYFFSPAPVLTEDIWRLSLGLGYRWNRNLVVKAEYSLEQRKELGRANRQTGNLFAAQAAFGF